MGKAKAELGQGGDKLRYHQLDLDSPPSVLRFRDYLKKEHGGLDLLVNNAGIAYKAASTASFAEQARVTNATNYFGTKGVCEALFPLLRPGARVVTVASRSGTMAMKKSSDSVRHAFIAAKTPEDVDALIRRFVELAQEGKHAEAGFPDSAYGMSKLGEIALSDIQARTLAKDPDRPDIILNSVCPGYVDTDMTSHKGPLTIAQGADSLVWLALLPPNDPANPVGKFCAERKVIDWHVGVSREEAFGKPTN